MIRDATPADRPAMLDLWVEAWAAACPAIDFAPRRAWLDQRLDRLRSEGVRVLVSLADDGRVAGFATIDPASGEMDQFVTAVWAQRRGAGGQLLGHVKQVSPSGVTLSVNDFNKPALRLYGREGFIRTGVSVSPASGLPISHMTWPGRDGGI